jgi:hypothetical protein
MSISLQAVEPQNVRKFSEYLDDFSDAFCFYACQFAYYQSLGFEEKGHIHINALYGEFTLKAFMWKP